MTNIVLKRQFNIPIYNVRICVVIAHDAFKAWKRYKQFNDGTDDEFSALSCEDGKGNFAMFFHVSLISHDDIGHEIKHIVDHHILPYLGEDKKAKEPPAYLTGYIHKRVYALIKKHKIKLND